MTLAPGTTLGRYQILEPLGQGGMATVYKAYQPALDRTVALKVIRRGFAEDPEFRERFQREARAIAKLAHPNIVQVHDFDETDGQLYLAMQYVEGGTLKDRLARLAGRGERMPQDEVATVVRQVAAALAYAHARGVIHRDVKPANVMLDADGSAIVTDFGIAKIVGGTQHTATGVGIGTPEYMSPEQGQGQPLDGRTDAYALAVTAYEMLTGTLPYTADTPFAVVLKHVRDPLPLPSKIVPAISARTEQVLLRALAKDPADRYPTVSDFAAELERSIAERPGSTLPTVVSPRREPPSGATEQVPAARRLPALRPLLRRPLLQIVGAIGLVLLSGGTAVVVGAFGTSMPSATPNVAAVKVSPALPSSVATTTVTPTPTPTRRPVTLRAEQAILSGSRGFHVTKDAPTSDFGIAANAWQREFELDADNLSRGGKSIFRLNLQLVIDPEPQHLTFKCDRFDSGGATQAERIPPALGDRSALCVYIGPRSGRPVDVRETTLRVISGNVLVVVVVEERADIEEGGGYGTAESVVRDQLRQL